jgi:hypothetical protein
MEESLTRKEQFMIVHSFGLFGHPAQTCTQIAQFPIGDRALFSIPNHIGKLRYIKQKALKKLGKRNNLAMLGLVA